MVLLVHLKLIPPNPKAHRLSWVFVNWSIVSLLIQSTCGPSTSCAVVMISNGFQWDSELTERLFMCCDLFSFKCYSAEVSVDLIFLLAPLPSPNHWLFGRTQVSYRILTWLQVRHAATTTGRYLLHCIVFDSQWALYEFVVLGNRDGGIGRWSLYPLLPL